MPDIIKKSWRISNMNCPVCACSLRYEIDNLLAQDMKPRKILDSILMMLSDKTREFGEFMQNYEQKKQVETLIDEDIAEKNKLQNELDALKQELNFKEFDIERHNEKHRDIPINWAFQQKELESGDIVENINMMQLKPHTIMYEGITGLTFINCNITNCQMPEDATIKGSNWHKSFCSHLHQSWELPKCKPECEHVIEKFPSVIDGVHYGQTCKYKDKVVS